MLKRGPAGLVGSWLIAVALCGAACGKTARRPLLDPPNGGSGANGGESGSASGKASVGAGGSNDGGAAAGEAGASGAAGAAVEVDGFPDPTTELGACLLYVRRQCEKREACSGGSSGQCAWNEGDCPDLLFAEASGWSVSSLVACSKAWRSFPCAELAAGELPECVAPGTIAVGEPCGFAAQCATLACLGASSSNCGQCAAVAEPGQDCGATLSCPGLQVCDESTGSCYSSFELRPALGETCEPDRGCLAGAYCNAALFKCESSKGEGEACSSDVACDADAELYCPASLGTCQPRALPRGGQPCAVEEPWCAANHFCERPMTTDVGTCRAPGGHGDPCSRPEHCQPALMCMAGLCTLLAWPEQSCEKDATRCHRSSNCVDSICQPFEPRDLLAERCP